MPQLLSSALALAGVATGLALGAGLAGGACLALRLSRR